MISQLLERVKKLEQDMSNDGQLHRATVAKYQEEIGEFQQLADILIERLNAAQRLHDN